MWSGLAEMRRGHHCRERRFDRSPRVGQEGRDAGQRLVRLGVKDVEDRSDEQGVAGLFPVVALFETAFRIDQDVGDVLNIAHFPFAAAHLEQRIIGSRFYIGRVKQQNPAISGAIARGERPVLALDVVNDRRAGPGQQRGHHQADALAAAGRSEAQHMLGTIVAQVMLIVAAEQDAIGTKQPGGEHFLLFGPSRRAVGFDALGLTSAPYRHADGDRDRDEPARRGDQGAAQEDVGRIGVVEIPPPEEGWRLIDGPPCNMEPGRSELRLKS